MKKFLLLLLCLSYSAIMFATSDGTTNFYKVSANGNATGRGLVYAKADNSHGPWLYKESVSSRFYGVKTASPKANIYLYAEPYEGYALEKWTDANGNTVTSGQSFTFDAASTTMTSPTANIFTAHFVDTYVSVISANKDLCAVSASPAINSPNQNQIVTLTATPKNGATFLGWRKKGTAAILSTQNPYKVTATSTKTTYEAVFRYIGTQLSFVKMQSQSESNKCLSLVQDLFSYTSVIGSEGAGGYSALLEEEGKSKALNKASEFLSRDISLNGSAYDPGQVLWHDASNKNFYAQGTNVGYITDGYNCHHPGEGSYHYVSQAKLKIDAQKIDYSSVNGKISMNPSVNLDQLGISMISGNEPLGNIYIINDNGEISVTQTNGSTDNYKWNKVPIDGENQYFAFNPEIQDAKTGKYYTTLRTSFSYKIKNPDKVTAYEINEIADGSVIMTPFAPDEVIPGDLAVVLESTSQEATDNILLPWNLEYTKTNTVLFNKYGHRLHCYTGAANSGDQYDGCTEGGIGYFKVAYNAANMGNMYKLSVNANGEVGFWTKVAAGETVSGNEGYSTVPCGLFKYAELDELPEVADQYTYHITDPLTVAYVDKNNVVYAKDDNGAAEQAPASGEEDFMALHYGENTYVDHSNWVAIEANSLPDLSPRDSRIEATGKVLESAPNRRMVATRVDEVDEEGFFDYNTYSIVNLMPKSSHSTAHHNFFFAAPQANEIANIIWAQWAGNNTFIVPPTSGFTGAVNADFGLYNDSNNPISKLQEGHQYQFLGLIERLATRDASTLYKVYPLEGLTDHEEVVTGVGKLASNAQVASVKYYNMMGVESDVPFQGVNIVVTRYTDGSQSTHKMLK